jgi:SHS family lactate transporter-like MFS transporter
MNAQARVATERRWGFSVSCGVLGWVLDAYSFFVPLFLLDPLAKHFAVSKSAVVATVTATLVMRPFGAFLFGWLSDRWGRKYPLMICVLWFSAVTAIMPFTSSFTIFVLLRALYGIGMGGYWGVGAALVMETCPVRWRGLFSGILQAGYSVGYLLAALTASIMEPKIGWPSMFLATLIVAGVIIVLLLPSVEPTRTAAAPGTSFKPWTILMTHWQTFAALTILMTVITCLSHGTQDLYPDFLMIVHGFNNQKVAELAILYNSGAALGAIVFGRLSDRLGRKHSIYCAMSLCLLAMPAWAFGRSFWMLALGSFVMQTGVQGAFGVVPAYLNEQSPSHARSFFAGLAYQLGMFFGAPCVIVEYAFRDRLGYGGALAAFEGCVFIALALVLLGIRERPSGLIAAASS